MARAIRLRFWRVLVDEICAIERIKPLMERARQQLRGLRIRNVRLRHGDGWKGGQVRRLLI